MSTAIKAKWKAFAVGEVLCNIEQPDWSDLFDRVTADDGPEVLQAILEETETAVWEPFEGWSCDRLTDYIADLADRLQKADCADFATVAKELDALLKSVGYERVSSEMGMSSSAVPELFARCAEIAANLQKEAA